MKNMTLLIVSALTFTALTLSQAQAQNYTSKDLVIVHRPIQAVTVPAPAANGLKISAWVNHKNNTYRPGDEVKMFVRSNRDVYVTVINVGTSGKVHQIFPNSYERSHLIKAHTSTPIPGRKTPYFFKASGPAGNELIKVIASKSPRPIIASQYLNKSVFPRVNLSIAHVAKDLQITLRHPAHRAKTAVYNKVIHIR